MTSNRTRAYGSLVFGILFWVFLPAGIGAQPQIRFQSGKPIWPEGREREKNLTVGFLAQFSVTPDERPVLRVTGATLYRAYVNGQFLGHGPARGPHGFFRVDEWELASQLKPGVNTVAIEVSGYNVNSYALLDQPSFLQAEVETHGKVLASTAGDGQPFTARILKERLQRVQRYSFQRPFSEVYRLAPGYDLWRTGSQASDETVRCALQPEHPLLLRRIPYPKGALRQPAWRVARGQLKMNLKPDRLWKDRSLTGIGPKLGGFLENELETIPSLELQRIGNASLAKIETPFTGEALVLPPRMFEIVDFGCNLTGFLGVHLKCQAPGRVFLAFDEILSQGDVDFKRLGCVNVVALELSAPGDYVFESTEPYTLRYLKLMGLEGQCEVTDIHLREEVNPAVWESHFASSDERLNRLFAAARETFRQNAVDIFMDCPSRERAGWLCDSYFTARTAFDLGGDTRVEKNFLENFQLPERFAFLPDGMLPMCYPADHNDGVFIPNWALWFVVELEEYLARSGDRQLAEALQPRIQKLFDYFQRFRNSDGLLEKLESWVFVEWSKANDFVQDVNYPSNMLYASALAAAGRMYQQQAWTDQANAIRAVIRKQAFDGEFFVDNALRKEGRLEVTRNRSEVCQYFAFYFEVATPGTFPILWRALREEFGPQRKQTKAFPEVHPANAFIGNVLRLEVLSRYGRCQQILDESIAYLLYMADQTGTLWENDGAYASCDHGFASHAAHVLYRDVLGLYQVDPVNRVINLRFSDLRLDWCEGSVPLTDGRVEVRWWKEGEKIAYRVHAPAGFEIKVSHSGNRALVRYP